MKMTDITSWAEKVDLYNKHFEIELEMPAYGGVASSSEIRMLLSQSTYDRLIFVSKWIKRTSNPPWTEYRSHKSRHNLLVFSLSH